MIPGVGPWSLVPLAERSDDNMATVPLCTTAVGHALNEGSVGWLDLGPGNLAAEILSPPVSLFSLPTWLHTQTGNSNGVQNEVDMSLVGKVILIPMFDGTCKVEPPGGALSSCPAGKEGQDPSGNNTWYHIPQFAAFYLEEAHIQGNNKPACNTLPGQPFVGGSGAISCMKGWFIDFITQGPVEPGGPPDPEFAGAIGVQLIQ
jgi:hypothetical protein